MDRESLVDKEMQAELAVLKVELEQQLDNLYEGKIRMVETKAIAQKELERFEKHKKVYQFFARKERFKLANEKLSEVVAGITNLAGSLSKIPTLQKPEAETRPVRE